MKTRLTILIILALALPGILYSNMISAKGGWYEPSKPMAGQPGWEKWDLHFTFYAMDWKEFQKMIEFYEGKPDSRVVGYCVADKHRAEIYVPRTNQGNVDYDTVGHEMLHVIDIMFDKCRFDPDGDKCKGREAKGKTSWFIVKQGFNIVLVQIN